MEQMNELANVNVYVNRDIMVTDSRNVSEIFSKRHDHVLRDIDNISKDIPNFGEMFFEGTSPDAYGRNQKIYYMNRDGFALLTMGFSGKEAMRWKLKYIEAFNALEREWNTPEQVMARALKIADQQIESLRNMNTTLLEDVSRMKPKEVFADAVAASKSSILIGELAKILRQNGIDTGEKRLFGWMRDNGYLIRRSGTDYNMPTQRSMEMRIFEIRERTIANPDGSIRITKTVLVTGKGQQYFINKFLDGDEVQK